MLLHTHTINHGQRKCNVFVTCLDFQIGTKHTELVSDMFSNVLPIVHYANAYAWQQQTIKTQQQQHNQNVHSIAIIYTLA
jgi:hypothetical protein